MGADMRIREPASKGLRQITEPALDRRIEWLVGKSPVPQVLPLIGDEGQSTDAEDRS
jgi:hypothetical protein